MRILAVQSEGMGINAACRVTGASKNTVLKLLADVGTACALYEDATMRNLKLTDVQVNEIWSFIGAKAKKVPADADSALCLGRTIAASSPSRWKTWTPGSRHRLSKPQRLCAWRR